MSGWPESGVVFTPSVVTPIFASVFSKVGMMPKMPIDPVMVEGSAKITSPGVDTQKPPDAATPPIETTTGRPSFFASSSASRMRSDAVTDPPGESTRRTSAFSFFFARPS